MIRAGFAVPQLVPLPDSTPVGADKPSGLHAESAGIARLLESTPVGADQSSEPPPTPSESTPAAPASVTRPTELPAEPVGSTSSPSESTPAAPAGVTQTTELPAESVGSTSSPSESTPAAPASVTQTTELPAESVGSASSPSESTPAAPAGVTQTTELRAESVGSASSRDLTPAGVDHQPSLHSASLTPPTSPSFLQGEGGDAETESWAPIAKFSIADIRSTLLIDIGAIHLRASVMSTAFFARLQQLAPLAILDIHESERRISSADSSGPPLISYRGVTVRLCLPCKDDTGKPTHRYLKIRCWVVNNLSFDIIINFCTSQRLFSRFGFISASKQFEFVCKVTDKRYTVDAITEAKSAKSAGHVQALCAAPLSKAERTISFVIPPMTKVRVSLHDHAHPSLRLSRHMRYRHSESFEQML